MEEVTAEAVTTAEAAEAEEDNKNGKSLSSRQLVEKIKSTEKFIEAVGENSSFLRHASLSLPLPTPL